LQGLAGENAVIPSNFTMRKYIVGTLILDRKDKSILIKVDLLPLTSSISCGQ